MTLEVLASDLWNVQEVRSEIDPVSAVTSAALVDKLHLNVLGILKDETVAFTWVQKVYFFNILLVTRMVFKDEYLFVHHALTENFDAIVEVPLVHFEIVVCIGGEDVRETRAGKSRVGANLKDQKHQTSRIPRPI